MIKRLTLKNFTAFSDIDISFSPGINVIIGENGTGKTHMLKAAYALCKTPNTLEQKKLDDFQRVRRDATQKLLRLFLPLENKLGKLCHRGAKDPVNISGEFALGKSVDLQFTQRSTYINIAKSKDWERYSWKPVMIPTKEVMSLVKGITSNTAHRETIESLFDDTYLDLCDDLVRENGNSIEHRIEADPRFGTIYPAMTEAIGGKYKLIEGEFCFQPGKYKERRASGQHDHGTKVETIFQPENGADISNNMTAEGFRKIGILQQLLVNNSIKPGISGPLFWDEPEANINPKLMKLLVEILLELSRNGQQIILATHDYVLLKWFDLLMKKEKEDHVRFHRLYQSPETDEITVSSVDDYALMGNSAISDTFAELYDEDVKRALA